MKKIFFIFVLAPFLSWGQVVNPPTGNAANFSCTPGAAIGTGGTCVCATNHSCTTTSGVLTVKTASSVTTGVAFTVVLYASAQTKYPNCVVDAYTTTAVSTAAYTLENSTGFTRQVFGTLSTSATYTVHYQCGY